MPARRDPRRSDDSLPAAVVGFGLIMLFVFWVEWITASESKGDVDH